MALILFRVFVLGVIAAVADAVPVTWSGSQRVFLPCVTPGAERVQARRPPPQLEPEDKSRPKSYVWWRNGKEISSKRVSPNGTLEVSRRGSGEGVYQCAAPLQFGSVLGYPLHLKFAYMDKLISVHPANGTASIGQPYIISCDINSAPPASVSWLRDAKVLPDDERYNFFGNQLLITEVRREDQGLYRCIATNPHVNKSRTSHGGRLQVQEFSEDLGTSLLPLEQHTNLVVPRGDRVVLACPVSGWPRPRLIWELTPPEGRVAELEVTDQVLVLTRLDFDLEGLYTCRVEGHSELIKTFNVTITEPVVINIPPSSKEVLRASTVRFNCSAKGRPKPKVTWFKNGKPLIWDGRFKLLSSPSAKERLELVISSITSEDAGVYQCFASSDASVASAWATLNVTGPGAEPPSAVRCQPVGASSVRVVWLGPADVFAYTVHTKIQAKPGSLLPGQPHNNTEEIVNIEQSLTPYRFHVRAYKQASLNIKNMASDFSEAVICQGQGVPIKLVKLDDDTVLVSWKEFADRTPGVVQWILQYKVQNTTKEHNITLAGNVHNYTFNVSPTQPLQIRLLGSKSLEWLHQNLTLIPWSSTTDAGRDLDSGEVNAVVEDVELEQIGLRGVRVRWRCCEGDFDPQRHAFYVCVKKIDGLEECQDSFTNSASIESLQPNSEYELQVQVRIPGREPGGRFSPPQRFTTQPEGPLRFKDLTYKFVNSSTLRVSWSGDPARYTVHYSAQLKLPVEQWASIETMGNTVLITGLQPTERTFVMLTGYGPQEHSRILTVPPQVTDLDVHYGYTNTGVKVSWTGVGPHSVRYVQNITRPLEEWFNINVTDSFVHLTDLEPSLTTYVMVTAPGPGLKSQVLTIPARPSDNLSFYLSVGIGSGVCILCMLFIAAFCIWHRKKRSRSPVRSRRRTQPANEANEEEGSEMKSVGGRLANGGGGKEAGEPLLNGHVHITENPTPKTPNGKMRKGRLQQAAFDVSRYDDQDATLETILDPDTPASTTYNLLDTSRRPEYDLSRPSRDVSANNSFAKLPDDNMNSEITRSTHFERGNSKIQPTLQPNG